MDPRAKALSVECRDGRMNIARNGAGTMHPSLLMSVPIIQDFTPCQWSSLASYPDYLIFSAEEKQTKARVKGMILSDQGRLKLASVPSRAEASAIQHRSGLLHSMAMHKPVAGNRRVL